MSEETKDKSSAGQVHFEGTRVDLGDDLMEKTVALVVPENESESVDPPVASMSTAEEIDDQLASARILIDEEITEDAKKLLHRILANDPGRVVARKMLEEIHEGELRQIFGDGEARPSLRRNQKPDPGIQDLDAEKVMRRLDHDLRLGIFDDQSEAPLVEQLSLFGDKAAMDAFAIKLDRDFGAATARERLDLGVAFLEMGLFELSSRQFRAALRRNYEDSARDEHSGGFDEMLSATCMLAYSLILGGRAFEAMLVIQPILQDVEAPKDAKLDLFYLMGRVNESLGKQGEATRWYNCALEIDDRYRDVRERLRKFAREKR